MNKLNCMMMAGTLLVTACQPTGKTGDVIGKQPVKVENGIMNKTKATVSSSSWTSTDKTKSKSLVLPNRKVMPYGSTEANK